MARKKHGVGFIADSHVGNHRRFGGVTVGSINHRCRLIIDSLGCAATIANEADCDQLVVAGDLFDTAKPAPQIVGATVRALDIFNGQVDLLVGNHDLVSTDSFDHAMGSVQPSDTFDIFDTPRIAPCYVGSSPTSAVIMIPFQPGDGREWLPAAVKHAVDNREADYEKSALCIHLGVYSDEYVAFVGGDKSRDAVPVGLVGDIMDQHSIDICFAGNWHARKEFKTQSGKPVIQIGSLAATGWNDKGLADHGMYLWEPATNSYEFREVAGPRFVDLPYGDEGQREMLALLDQEPKAHTLFVRGQADTREGMLDLADRVRAIGATPDISVDQTIAKAAAKSSAVVARSASTRIEALDKFIGAMDLKEDIDRGEIRERCTRYLASGGT